MFDKIYDFLIDMRGPIQYYHIEKEVKRRKNMIKSTPPQKDIPLCLTVDVEQDYGSLSKDGRSITANKFLKIASENFKELGKACFFVQGSILEENGEILKEYAKEGHDIGLHGYYHELWGKTQWYLKDKSKSLEQKRLLLQKAKNSFEKIGLEFKSFRAPNMVIDEETLSLLIDEKIFQDSSGGVHRGENPLPKIYKGMKRIPVSASPFPDKNKKFGISYHRFIVFNMYNLLRMNRSTLINFVDIVTKYQVANGFKPHLVFLCHSWEFFDTMNRNPSISYSSKNNFLKINECYNIIAEEFGCKITNFHDLFELI